MSMLKHGTKPTSFYETIFSSIKPFLRSWPINVRRSFFFYCLSIFHQLIFFFLFPFFIFIYSVPLLFYIPSVSSKNIFTFHFFKICLLDSQKQTEKIFLTLFVCSECEMKCPKEKYVNKNMLSSPPCQSLNEMEK